MLKMIVFKSLICEASLLVVLSLCLYVCLSWLGKTSILNYFKSSKKSNCLSLSVKSTPPILTSWDSHVLVILNLFLTYPNAVLWKSYGGSLPLDYLKRVTRLPSRGIQTPQMQTWMWIKAGIIMGNRITYSSVVIHAPPFSPFTP